MTWCRDCSIMVELLCCATVYGLWQERIWRQSQHPACLQIRYWKSSKEACKQEEVQMWKRQLYSGSPCPGWKSEGRWRVNQVLLSEEDSTAVLENCCRVCFCLQASAAAIIPFSGAFVGELEQPLLLHYVQLDCQDCRLVRWPITALTDAAWATVSSQSALYEAFTGATYKAFSP